MAAGTANQSRFLGALLGMGIGDALGMPVAGWTPAQIEERYRAIDDYHRHVFEDGAEIKAGEFTDDSEIALCIVETATANDGLIDPDLLGPRMLFLARGESKRWMHPDTLRALELADERHLSLRPCERSGQGQDEGRSLVRSSRLCPALEARCIRQSRPDHRDTGTCRGRFALGNRGRRSSRPLVQDRDFTNASASS